MAELHFCVKDGDHPPERRALVALLTQLGLIQLADLQGCDLVAAHQKSDPLNSTQVAAIRNGGGIYIEYSTGNPNWEILADRYVYGSYAELLERLRQLRGDKGVGLQDIASVLESPVEEVREESLAALAILCQGFLIVHAASQGVQDNLKSPIGAALKQMGYFGAGSMGSLYSSDVRQSLVQHNAEVSLASWWLDGIGIQGGNIRDSFDEFQSRIEREWAGGRQNRSLPLQLEDLVKKIGDGYVQPCEIVAGAYRVLVERLGGRLCGSE